MKEANRRHCREIPVVRGVYQQNTAETNMLTQHTFGTKVNLKRNEKRIKLYLIKVCSLFGNAINIPFLLYFALPILLLPLEYLGF